MSQRPLTSESAEMALDSVLRDYTKRVERGESVDTERLIAAHPEMAEALMHALTDIAEGSTSKSGRNDDTVLLDSVVVAGEIQIPKQFGRYRIRQTLGEGAMGAVFLAEDQELKRRVALKIPKFPANDNGDVLERFYQEARTAATLQHRNICPVFDIGEIDETRYISMAYIEGKPLSAIIAGSKHLDQRKIAHTIRKLAIACHEAHEEGVVHRDLKPSNIMIDKKGQPVIMDFGLARQLNTEDVSRLTQTGQIMGSPAYMSPEQVEESGSVGPASDIYSLGIVFYELLTGRAPFRGSLALVLGKIMTEQPAPPTAVDTKIAPDLEAICLKMIAKKTENRFASMGDVVLAINKYLKAPGTGDTATPKTTKRKKSKKKEVADTEEMATVLPPVSKLRNSKTKSRRRQKSHNQIAGIPRNAVYGMCAAAIGLILLASIVLVVRTSDGTVTVELAEGVDDDIKIEVSGNGKVHVADKSNQWKINVEAGRYQVDLKGGNDRLSLNKDEVVVRRKKTEIVRVSVTALPREENKPPTEHPSDNSVKPMPKTMPPPDTREPNPNERLAKTVAEWVLKKGGTIETTVGDFKSTDRVPQRPFLIVAISLARTGVRDAELANLKELTSLRRLELGSTKTGDDGLAHLAELTNLTRLVLNNTQISNEGLRHLTGLKRLNYLNLDGTRVDDSGLRHVSELTNLDTLLLSGTSVGNAGLGHLERLVYLTTINLDGTQVSDPGLSYLKGMKRLEYLGLGGTSVGDAGLEHIRELDRLAVLRLQGTRISDRGLMHLKGLERLSELHMEGTKISNAGLRHLVGLKRLSILHLRRTLVNGLGLQHLGQLANLTKLYLGQTRISDSGFEHLTGLKKLSVLDLDVTRVGDKGLVHIAELTTLTALGLSTTRVTDVGVRHLSRLKNLRMLNLDVTRLSDSSAAQLKGLTNLTQLYFSETLVTNAGISDLKQLKNLTLLHLYSTQIDDAAINDLASLTKLQELGIGGTDITTKGLKDLSQALPGCRIGHPSLQQN